MEIETDIPIPPRLRGGRQPGEAMRTARAMQVGHSTFCETPEEKEGLRKAMKRIGFGVTTRKEGNGWRVWRIECAEPLRKT